MSEPTDGEREFADDHGLDASALGSARDVLNTIAGLPWPEPERVALLARLARASRADVGSRLGLLALRAAPVASFDHLMAIDGLADKRVTGLVRALAGADVSAFTTTGTSERELRKTLQAAWTEIIALRRELNQIRAGTARDAPHIPAVMRLDDMASSLANQVGAVAEALRAPSSRLRLVNVDVSLAGTGASLGEDIALDLGAPMGASAVSLSFSSGEAPAARPHGEVPDVRGYTLALARRKLADNGWVAVATSTVTAATGVVAEQTPTPRSVVPHGTVVRLVVR
jgi:hypothetical protein